MEKKNRYFRQPFTSDTKPLRPSRPQWGRGPSPYPLRGPSPGNDVRTLGTDIHGRPGRLGRKWDVLGGQMSRVETHPDRSGPRYRLWTQEFPDGEDSRLRTTGVFWSTSWTRD